MKICIKWYRCFMIMYVKSSLEWNMLEKPNPSQINVYINPDQQAWPSFYILVFIIIMKWVNSGKKPKYFWIFFFREAPHILRIPKHHPVFCLIPGISFFPPFSYENVHGVNQFSYKLFTLCYGISSNTRKNVIFFYTIT